MVLSSPSSKPACILALVAGAQWLSASIGGEAAEFRMTVETIAVGLAADGGPVAKAVRRSVGTMGRSSERCSGYRSFFLGRGIVVWGQWLRLAGLTFPFPCIWYVVDKGASTYIAGL